MNKGDLVAINTSKGSIIGTLEIFVPKGKILSDTELLQYCNLKPGDKWYTSVRGENCKVNRIIFKCFNGNFITAPLWQIEFL